MGFLKGIVGKIGDFVIHTAGEFIFWFFVQLGIAGVVAYGMITGGLILPVHGLVHVWTAIAFPMMMTILWIGATLFACVLGILLEVPVAVFTQAATWGTGMITIDRLEARLVNVSVLGFLYGLPALAHTFSSTWIASSLGYNACTTPFASLLNVAAFSMIMGVLVSAVLVAFVDYSRGPERA